MDPLSPRIQRLKNRLLEADYEICLSRARHFTESYRITEGQSSYLRSALALKRTLDHQQIEIYPDELLVGSKTEKYLAGLLPVERGDYLRVLELEKRILRRKRRPFHLSDEDARYLRKEVLPYWAGRTVRDFKIAEWNRKGLIDLGRTPAKSFRTLHSALRFFKYLGRDNLRSLVGKTPRMPWNELAKNNPTAAVMCFDVQGHLSIGFDRVIEKGMSSIIESTEQRLARLEREEPENIEGAEFLKSVVVCLRATLAYADRFADLAEAKARGSKDAEERSRLSAIAERCRSVPRHAPRTFHEALQSLWFTELVGEIQYGMHDVIAVGRLDQYLLPFYERDLHAGQLTRTEAMGLVQELFLKLSTNLEPLPEVGMQAHGLLGLSPHTATIGGVTPDGRDATNPLSYLILDAFRQMSGAVCGLSVRVSPTTPREFLEHATSIANTTNGLGFYNDEAIVRGLLADGLTPADARDYCLVGCVETGGQSNTHGCPAAQELVLPAVLLLSLTQGQFPPAAPGQMPGLDCGAPKTFRDFDALLFAFRSQLRHQIRIFVDATASRDLGYQKLVPYPYISALTDGCIEKAKDVTLGGAKYDFTSIVVRGLGTVVDSLLAVKELVFERREMELAELVSICLKNFAGSAAIRQKLIHRCAKYGNDSPVANELTLQLVDWIHREATRYTNVRGGKYRVSYYSHGSHVIDGFLLGATPDGRLRGQPTSNGASPSNLVELRSPLEALSTVAKLPPEQVSSGIALNLRFHPSFFKGQNGSHNLASMIRTYFKLGGMQLQPNVVSSETLRDAQSRPHEYRDLVVKVSGYSAYFVDLGKPIQDDIIARQEFRA